MFSFGFFVVHDAIGGCENNVSKLSWGKNLVHEILKVFKFDIESRGDNTTLIQSSIQFHYNFAISLVIYYLKLPNVP